MNNSGGRSVSALLRRLRVVRSSNSPIEPGKAGIRLKDKSILEIGIISQNRPPSLSVASKEYESAEDDCGDSVASSCSGRRISMPGIDHSPLI